MDLSYEFINFPFFKSEQDVLSINDFGLHGRIVFGVIFIEPLNSFEDTVSESNVFVDPFSSLFDVLADFGELENRLNEFEDVHDHKLHAFGNVVEIKGLVKFVAGVKNIVDLQSVFGRVANEILGRGGFLIIQDSCLVHEKIVVNKNTLRAEVKSISSEVIQFVHVDTGFFVRNQFKFPFPQAV